MVLLILAGWKNNLLAYILSTFDLDSLSGIVTVSHLVIDRETLS